LSGKAGRIVHRQGNRWALNAADRINAVPGAVPRENTVGTNSLGTTLHLGAAVGINTWQHFCEAFWEWSDVGAPVHHPVTGEVIGAVDLGLYKKPLSPAFGLAVKAMVGRIQAALLAREAAFERSLVQRSLESGRGQDNAWLAVDRHGRIAACTPAATRLLEGDGTNLDGRRLAEFAPLSRLALTEASRTLALRLQGAQDEATVSVEPVLVEGHHAGAVLRLEQARRPDVRGERARRPRAGFEELIGTGPAFSAARTRAQRAARTGLPILLSGETGTGKELFAQAIHLASARADGPFVAVNCGAVPAELIASELFGYEKGAFTGASGNGRRGKFEQADGGTIFLDEITEASPPVQVSLLRVLEDLEVIPLGAEKGRRVDVRVISATNRDPEQAVAAGVLRQDLYYRLKGAWIALPSLRQRVEDIPQLVGHFCRVEGRSLPVSPAAMEMLLAYRWPGNVRELRSVICSAAALADGRRSTALICHPACMRPRGMTARPDPHGRSTWKTPSAVPCCARWARRGAMCSKRLRCSALAAVRCIASSRAGS
jgi:transcriptional regulator of acetoin/glycerol metabolism